MQVVAGALVMVAGLGLGGAGWLGLRGGLPRNRFVGVRTATTMASNEAFRLANRVAGPVLVAAGTVGVLGGLAVLVAPPGAAFAVVLGVAAAGALGLALAGGVLGSRAATLAAPETLPAPARPAVCTTCTGCLGGTRGSSGHCGAGAFNNRK